MSREVCGMCWCPYGDDGRCACPVEEVSSKPVAWMDYLEHSDVYDLNVSGRGIPLYTHPVKQLSDEEIMKIHDSFGNGYISYLDFAKAIIKEITE